MFYSIQTEYWLHCCLLIYGFYKSADCHDNVKRFLGQIVFEFVEERNRI